jgi:HK97 family phage prohead protease
VSSIAPFNFDVALAEKAVEAEDGDIVISGYAADFETDRQGEVFLPGAFDEACAKASENTIPLLFEHDNTRQLGVIEELKVDDQGLWARARIAKAAVGSWAEDIVNKIRRGMLRGLSVRGLSLVRDKKISYIDLAEVSVTSVPAQPGALFAVATKSIEAAEDSTAADLEALAVRANRLRRELDGARPTAPAATRKSSDDDLAALRRRADQMRRELSREMSPAKPAPPKASGTGRQPVRHPPSAGVRSGDEIRVERSGVTLADIHGDTARGGLSVRSEEKDEDTGEVVRREYTLPAGALDWGDPRPHVADSRLEDGPPSPEEGFRS